MVFMSLFAISYPVQTLELGNAVAYPTRIKTLKTLNYEFEHLAKRLFNQ